jgi:hypothetical protein
MAWSPAGIPSGTVDFFADTVKIGTGTVDSSGQASVSIDTLPAGDHAITAQYSGDGVTYAPSVSPTLVQHVFTPAASIFARRTSVHAVRAGISFSVVAFVYDANGKRITNYTGTATITEISGPDGAFRTRTVKFKNGRFLFRGLKVSKGGLYTLEVSTPGANGPLTYDVHQFKASGRLS